MRLALLNIIILSVGLTFGGEFQRYRELLLESGGNAFYKPIGRAFAGYNTGRYNNRPLYCNHMPAFVLAGDKPYCRLMNEPYIYGGFMVAVFRGGDGKWLDEFSEIISVYEAGSMKWLLKDSSLEGLELCLEAVGHPEYAGMCLKLSVNHARSGDSILWTFGGASKRPERGVRNLNWDFDVMRVRSLINQRFDPESCKNNEIELHGNTLTISPPAYEAEKKIPQHKIYGVCSDKKQPYISDASLWQDPEKLSPAQNPDLPLVCGDAEAVEGNEIYWTFTGYPEGAAGTQPVGDDAENVFQAAIERVREVSGRVVVDTPNEKFDAGVAATCIVEDARWYPPNYVHGPMAWNRPYLGWRTIYGPAAYGYHDNIKRMADYHFDYQVKESDKTYPEAHPNRKLTMQSGNSMYYGRGRIDNKSNGFYNFQSIFFDQLCYDWRYTADEEFEKMLLPALELHLDWTRRCFDPDDNGLYESYINTWPTDSVWYNGGDSTEETSFAYRGHLTAMEMSRRAGDRKAQLWHKRRARKIRQAMQNVLWLDDRGHFAVYREQGGHRRLHKDAWLYSVFMPIDAGLISKEQAAQSLYYTEWGLERVKMPYGGQRCWLSNWVPSMWSVRELTPNDNYHLALAYYQTGLPEEGWDIFRGNYLESMYYSVSPGSLGQRSANDFAGTSSMFARVTVEGIFGYNPDYPNGKVLISPQMPAEWEHGSIKAPDFSLSFKKSEGRLDYKLKLDKPAKIQLRIPVYNLDVESLKVNGKEAEFNIAAGFGQRYLEAETNKISEADVYLRTSGKVAKPQASYKLNAEADKNLTLSISGADITNFKDPQGLFVKAQIVEGTVKGRCSRKDGNFLVFALASETDQKQWKLFKMSLKNPAKQKRLESRKVSVPQEPNWRFIDIEKSLNSDIREIYKQEYLSPRPNTCSLRIGIDGYSSWTFTYTRHTPPAVKLDNVPELLDDHGRVVSDSGVPFEWHEGDNIAFSSLWDNWPDSVEIDVNTEGSGIWFLVAGSTNPMQTRIANARLVINYSDGSEDEIDIEPPLNFWSLSKWGDTDYDYQRDGFCLPDQPPAQIQLGENCRAMVISRVLKENVKVKSVKLECLSQEVVIGLMSITVNSNVK